MGTAIVQMKIMPASPEADLEEIKKAAKKIIQEKSEISDDSVEEKIRFEENPIAFGLKAIIATFGWPEEEDLDGLQEELRKIENTNSVEVADMRRAVG